MSSTPRLSRRPFARQATWVTVAALIASVLVPASAAVASDLIASSSASATRIVGAADAGEVPAVPVVSIIGTAQVGVELTADPGDWPDGVTLTYQWQVGGSDIEGATGTSYAPAAADRGKSVRVTVTGDGEAFPAASVASAPTEPVALGELTPSSRPVISGTVQVGSAVTASAVRWTPSAVGSYFWRVDGEYVPGAVTRTYTIRPEDAGKALTVGFSGVREGYRITSVTSDPVRVAYGELTAPVPTIIGLARIDELLSVDTGTWTPKTRLSYQWSVGGSPVEGATGTTYTVRQSDADKPIAVAVSGSKFGYVPATAVSAPTAPVSYGTLIAPKPTVSGAARVGVTLSARVGAWTEGAALSYQWLLDGRPVAGATGKKLTLQPSDRGKRVSFAVTGSLLGHKTTRVVSAPSAAVTPGKLATAVPLISGKAKHGVTLVAKPGKWSEGTALSYRWYVDRKLVAGATSKSFTPARAHIGKSVIVKVTGRKTGYTSVTKTSAPTKPVAKKSVFRLTILDIVGTPKVGRALVASADIWVPEMRYQWYVGGKAVAGANSDTFVPRAADRGKTVKCKVTIRKPGYVTATMTSERTAAVR